MSAKLKLVLVCVIVAAIVIVHFYQKQANGNETTTTLATPSTAAVPSEKPIHSFVFTRYTTYNGDPAFVFESDERAYYTVTCNEKPPKNCNALRGYLHQVLPPTYLQSVGDGQEQWLSIPSLDLELEVENVN